MWGKPNNASSEITNDWYVVPIDLAEDGPVGVVGVFQSESLAWDWLVKHVADGMAGGGRVFQLTRP